MSIPTVQLTVLPPDLPAHCRGSSMLTFRSNYPSGRSSPKTGRNGAPLSPRRKHETIAQEVGIIEKKSHAIRESHSKQKRAKPPSTMKQQTRTLCTGCRASLIPASYWESISSIQFSTADVASAPKLIRRPQMFITLDLPDPGHVNCAQYHHARARPTHLWLEKATDAARLRRPRRSSRTCSAFPRTPRTSVA